MKKPNTANVTLLRTVAQNAIVAGQHRDAQRIYQRLLKIVEEAYGKDSSEYNECLTDAARSLRSTLLEQTADAS
jgi:hypothetical protein